MKRRFAIFNGHATEIFPITRDEMDINFALHPSAIGIPIFFNEGRFFPAPIRDIIIVQDYYGF